MMLKAVILPFFLIVCFGGGFVAMTKPFNIKATAIVFAFAIALLVFGYASGVPKIVAGCAIIGSLFGLSLVRLKR